MWHCSKIPRELVDPSVSPRLVSTQPYRAKLTCSSIGDGPAPSRRLASSSPVSFPIISMTANMMWVSVWLQGGITKWTETRINKNELKGIVQFTSVSLDT